MIVLVLHQELIFFVLPVCADELLSTPIIIIFLPKSKFAIKKIDRQSNPKPYPE